MSSKNRTTCARIAWAVLATSLSLSAPAQSLEQVLNAQQQRVRQAQESQERVEKVVQDTRKIEDQYKGVLKEIEGLQVYNRLLSRQVSNQVQAMTEIRESIDQVEVINRQIIPIMTSMISSLRQFVELDVPFQIDERTERVAGLEELMERQDVTVAEKFRKVTEAYQIENDYGRTIETYKETLNIDGADREVDILRIGRIALLYQTADARLSGVWDQKSRQWQELGNEYRSSIRFGLQVAKKQVAPDLVIMPVDAPEAL